MRQLPVQHYLSSSNILKQTECRSDINMTSLLIVCCFSLLLAGVFSADVTVSVMKEDDVTLLINPEEIKGAERLLWKLKTTIIATIDLEVENSQAEYPDKEIQKFRGRLNLERNTGSLTINKITTEDTGEYQLEIRSSDGRKYKTFSVAVNEVESVSQTKDKSVILHTNTEIQSDDVIEWKFKNTLIAQFNRMTKKFSLAGGKWKDRLQMEPSGSLTIQQLKTEDSGPYDVNINNSNRFIHKRINVTVTESRSRSHQVKIGPGLFVVVILLVIAMV